MKYVLHVRNLTLYIDLGMKLTKIHRVLQFDESPWLQNTLILTLNKGKKQKMILKKIILN